VKVEVLANINIFHNFYNNKEQGFPGSLNVVQHSALSRRTSVIVLNHAKSSSQLSLDKQQQNKNSKTNSVASINNSQISHLVIPLEL